MIIFTVFSTRSKYRFSVLVVMFYLLLPYTKSGAAGTVQMSGWLQCWCCWWRETEELQRACL